MAVVAPAFRERPVQFGRSGGLFGVICLPASAEPSDSPVVVMLNSGLIHRIGANRIHVLLARALAEIGVRSLRFDLSGIGDSERSGGPVSLAESVSEDIGATLEFLSSRYQARSFVLFGLCSGAYDALRWTLRDHRAVGVVAIDVPGSFRNLRHLLVHYKRRMFTVTSWRNAASSPAKALGSLLYRVRYMRKPPVGMGLGVRPTLPRDEIDATLSKMSERGVRSLFLFTTGLEDNYNYEHQFRDCFPKQSANPIVSYGFFADADHTFSRMADRQRLIAAVTDWYRQASFERSRLEGQQDLFQHGAGVGTA